MNSGKLATLIALTALIALAVALVLNAPAPSVPDSPAATPAVAVAPASETPTPQSTGIPTPRTSTPAAPRAASTPIPSATPAPNATQNRTGLDVGLVDLFSGGAVSGAASGGDADAATVEEVIELGLRLAGASPTHLAFRGTVADDSIRCDWRGVARTPEQREAAIRFWLDLEDGDSLPPPDEVERRFADELERVNAVYPATVQSNFRAIARGGLSEEYLFLTCYADYTVQEYLLGSGTTGAKQTVAYDRMGEARSYDLYVNSHEEGEFAEDRLMSESDYQDYLDLLASDAELILGVLFEDSEAVIFLAPMGDHNAIAVEAWQAVAQWDVQRADDGTVNAVRYGASSGDPERSQTLANLKSRVSAATAPPTPTPTPAPGNGNNADYDPDDTSATSTVRRIGSVSGLAAHYRSIGAYGDITPGDSSSDTFTPAQPPPMHVPPPANLAATLSGDNGASLTWSAASGASGYDVQRRIQADDSLWEPESSGQTATTLAVSGLLCETTHEFRVGAYGDGTAYSDRTGLWSEAVSLAVDACSAKPPKFAADSYSFEADTLTASGAVVGTVSATDANGDAVSYSFEDAGIVGGAPVVSSVLATSGSEQVRLDIDSSSGELKLFGPLGALAGSTYNLTVGASDSKGGTATASVTLAITAPTCASGTAVANPESHHWLVQDCLALLALKDALRGTASLNWSASSAVSGWDGVTVSGTPKRVTTIDLRSKSLGGTLPAGLARLTKLSVLRLGGNSLTGSIPAELGGLSNLETLGLPNNSLSGDVPASLGGLRKLAWVRMFAGNSLTGCIPRGLKNVADGDASTSGLPDCNSAPAFASASYAFSVSEDSAVGAAVGTVSTTDADGDTPTYAISAGNADGKFAIGADTGKITLAAALDYEKATSYSLTITATDGFGGSATATVNVSVTDVVDAPPAPTGVSASHSSGTFTVSWSAVSGADLYRVGYRVQGAGGAWTHLPTTSGTTLTYSPTVASSCGKTYEFRAEARGDGTIHAALWGEASDAASASADACNRLPAFEKVSYSFAVLEMTTRINTVRATDPDGEEVTYSIASGNADGKFALALETFGGARRARLSATSEFDHETKSAYSLTIRATDTRGGYTDAAVKISVYDVSEDPPVALSGVSASVSGTTVTLSWNQPSDTLITGYRITRRVQGSDSSETISVTGLETTTYVDSGLSANTKYIYRVSAVDYFKRVGVATRLTATTGGG